MKELDTLMSPGSADAASPEERSDQLRQIEANLTIMINASPESAFLIDTDTVVIACNKHAAERLGCQPEEIIGRPITDFITSELAAARLPYLTRVIASGEAIEFEDCRGTRTMRHYLRPVLTDRGRVHRVAIFAHDVTDFRSAESSLKRQNELLAAVSRAQELFISGHDPSRIYDHMLELLLQATDSPCGFIDEVLYESNGRPYKRNLALSDISWDTKSKQLFENLHTHNLELPVRNNLVGLPALEKRTIIANDVANDPRFRGLPEDHPPIFRYLGLPVVYGAEVIGVVGVANRAEDYTEAIAEFIKPLIQACTVMIQAGRGKRRDREMLAALQASEERYRRIAENMTDVVWIADLNLQLSYVSPSIERMMGEPAAMHMQRSMEEKLPQESLHRVYAILAEELEREKDPYCDKERSRVIEVQHYRADGRLIWIAMNVSFVRDDTGRPIALQGVTREITERKEAEQALIESERKWRNILLTTPQIGISLDPKGRIIFANDHFLKLTGWSAQEVLGQDWFDWFIPEAIREEIRQVFDKVKSSRDTLGYSSYENDIVTRTGEVRTIAWSNVLTKDAQGKVVDVTCLGIDLTERIRTEEELRRSEAKYRLLVENQTDLVVKVDLDGRFLFVSPSYCRVFNKSEEELLGRSFMPMVHEEDREQTARAMEALFHPPHTAYVEQRALTKDGWTWLAWVDTAVLDSEGKVKEIIGVGRDISERKRAEAQSRQLSDIIEKSVNEIYVFDPQSLKFRHVNQGALKNLGYTMEQIKELTPLDLKPEFTEASFRALIQPLIEYRQESLTFETFHRRADGSFYPVEVRLQLMDAEGERVFLAVMFDISERRRAEEEREKLRAQLLQAQKMESVGRLAGGVAHDFNNMLGVILGYLEFVFEQVRPADPLFDSLQEIRRAAERSVNLTRQLLAFARKQTIAPTVLDLNETVEGTLKMLRRLIGEDIDLAWLPGKSLWPVKIDRSQLDQVLANLCVNARDAIAGVGKIIIETHNVTFDPEYCTRHPQTAPGHFAMLSVSDDGCGMDAESLGHLFEPFYTTKEVGKGTGLGLATVYGIVTQNQGFIDVSSEPGRGTTFKLYFPRCSAQELGPKREETAETLSGQGQTVLLVEDEPGLLKIDQLMLEKLGYRTLAAAAPNEALALAELHGGKIDLLLTDVVMPQMTGQELASRLQAGNPQLRCLFMSGYSADIIAQHGVLDGAVHFIQKPFTMKDLAAKVRAALEG